MGLSFSKNKNVGVVAVIVFVVAIVAITGTIARVFW